MSAFRFPSVKPPARILWKMGPMAKIESNAKQAGRAATRNYCSAIGWMAACSMLCVFVGCVANAASDAPLQPGSAKQIVSTVMANEELAGLHRDHYAYGRRR